MLILGRSQRFPDPRSAGPDGLLAVGGDLSLGRLLAAYSRGIFPWPHEGLPLLWFSPDPRMLLFPGELRVSRSLRKSARRLAPRITADTAFARVVRACATVPRPGQPGTWITPAMQRAYLELHRQGWAHSVEVWVEGELVGGLYGVSVGAQFCGESMFHLRPDASKLAFAALAIQAERWGFHFLDLQLPTSHLASLGGRPVPRDDYLERLERAVAAGSRRGPWRLDPELPEAIQRYRRRHGAPPGGLMA